MTANPLLTTNSLPAFRQIEPQHVTPAIHSLIDDCQQGLEQQLKHIRTLSWESLVLPIEERNDALRKAWSPIGHLNAVSNSDTLRKAYEESQQLITSYYTQLGQNSQLYQAYRELKNHGSYAQLSGAQKKTIEDTLRDFELSGVALEGEAKNRYAAIQSRLATLSTQFSNHVLDATDAWYKQLDSLDALAGLPDFIIQGAKQAARDKQCQGYVLTLDMPVYFTVITQADNRDLRQDMYRAFSTRASEQGPLAGQWDNSPLIEEILSLRQEMASLLGFNNYAELSIASKMASSTQQVVDFLESLADKAKVQAEKEYAELCAFAKQEYGIEQLEAWDVSYYSEKLKQAKFSVSQESMRPYFPLGHVLKGLFQVASKVFDIDIKSVEEGVELYHNDAKFFKVYRQGQHIASFYLDLYARGKKRSGAWMDDCRVRRITREGKLQLPVAYMVCNFNAPVGNLESLLNHNEVTTLFHEFGHGLHHMLTQIDIAAVSGINGVAWDAVELPSQFLENFCWEREVLAFLSSHHETGQALPDAMLDNMLDAKNFQSAMIMLRQIEFALFDFKLHMAYGKPDFPGVQQLLDTIRQQVAVYLPPDFNRFQHSFSHIFSGGYAAGYYSYKWAEVLSADVYAAFEEAGIFNRDVCQRYLREIIEPGGSQDAADLFRNFRGREPTVDALLRHSGIQT